jgi:hypothetical protein
MGTTPFLIQPIDFGMRKGFNGLSVFKETLTYSCVILGFLNCTPLRNCFKNSFLAVH